jgi:hypothetical protein
MEDDDGQIDGSVMGRDGVKVSTRDNTREGDMVRDFSPTHPSAAPSRTSGIDGTPTKVESDVTETPLIPRLRPWTTMPPTEDRGVGDHLQAHPPKNGGLVQSNTRHASFASPAVCWPTQSRARPRPPPGHTSQSREPKDSSS